MKTCEEKQNKTKKNVASKLSPTTVDECLFVSTFILFLTVDRKRKHHSGYMRYFIGDIFIRYSGIYCE